MTTVSTAPPSPPPSKGFGGRTSAAVPGDDFAAMLAGLVGAVAPAAVPVTAEGTADGTPGAVTVAGRDTLPPATWPAYLHLGVVDSTTQKGAVPGATAAPAAAAPEGVGVPAPAALPTAVPSPTAPSPETSSAPPTTAAPSPTAPSPETSSAPPTAPAPSPTAPSPVPSSTPLAATIPTAQLSATPPTGADLSPTTGGDAAGLRTAPPSTPPADAEIPTTVEQDLSADPEQVAGNGAGEGTDDGAPAATPAAAPVLPAETSRVAGAVPAVPAETLAAAPVADSRPVSAPTPPPPAAPPPPPAVQVVQQLAPVLEGPDGSYTMSLQLYPEELGAVQVEISLRGGEISLVLHASDDVSKELLRASLGELRAQLEATGLSATDVSVDSGAAPDRDEQPAAQRPATPASVDDGDDSPAPASAPDPDAALDLRM